jgi:hypothetical protein
MAAKLVMFAGLAGIAGYVGYTASSYDPYTVSYPKAQVESMLLEAKVELPRRDNTATDQDVITIWGEGRSEQGVKLNMRYAQADWAPLIECNAVIQELAPDKTRVTPDCSDGPESDDAISRTENQLREPMFDEFIQSTLHQRAFDRSRADSKEMAIVMTNMGGMQREALKRADEAQRDMAGQ